MRQPPTQEALTQALQAITFLEAEAESMPVDDPSAETLWQAAHHLRQCYGLGIADTEH